MLKEPRRSGYKQFFSSSKIEKKGEGSVIKKYVLGKAPLDVRNILY